MSAIGMETVAARLATFYITHEATAKGRGSSAKTTTQCAWPHERPSPEELAHAGFYYKPTSLSPDNAACYLCERALDGWEEEDDPVTEHLKHSGECGWATMMDIARQSSNPNEIEDPTSPAIVEARRATFGSLWPHDGKRGWLIEAGWYFCPSDESDDFVSCAYCKLSLDGWEPKDDPFDEHHRRSPECSFFVFATKKSTKASRSKKTRGSKASRLSTQSTATTASEAPTVDFDDEMDQSTISQAPTKAPKTTKKATKAKGRKTKSKKGDPVEVSSQADMESNNGDHEEPARPKRATRGKKRTSDAMTDTDGPQTGIMDAAQSEPPTKKRATRSSNTAVNRPGGSILDHAETAASDEPHLDLEEQTAKGRKSKRSSSKTRKPSTASVASLRSQIPNDAEIEAELEAALMEDIDVKGHETVKAGKEHTSNASTAPSRPVAPQVMNISDSEEEPATKPQKGRAKKNPSKKKTTTKKNSGAGVDEPSDTVDMEETKVKSVLGTSKGRTRTDSQAKKSLTREELPRNVSADIDIGTKQKDPPKRAARPKLAADTKKPKSQRKTDNTVADEPAPIPADLHESPLPTKTRTQTQRQEADTMDIDPLALEPQRDQENRRSGQMLRKVAFKSSKPNGNQQTLNTDRIARASNNPKSPISYVHESTPSPPPQSSDAENRPPSSRPSTNRPVPSASKSHTTFVPLAASTPTSSPLKRSAQSGQLITSHPWNPVDPEEVFLSDPMDKENTNINDILHSVKGDLTSPEKHMTVEEWINWNAKNGEAKLRSECERLVGIFEREGGKAMMALEGIECTD
ncbi:hypothetical protein FQN51_005274 [Onygenales sp. PD_10]|nr:hypothetical protein FQN51_005274 [Onygenales sp. PD_10]